VRSVRLLFVITGISGGGTERSLCELVPALAKSGADVSIAYMVQRKTDAKAELEGAGARLYHVMRPRLDGRIREVRSVIALEHPDIVHTSLFDADVAGRLAAWRAPGGSPIVLSSIVNTSYDPARLDDPNVRSWKLRAVRLVDGWTARHLTDHFHAVSCAVKDAAVQALGIDPNRVTVIERGRDPGRLGEPSPERRRRVRAKLAIDQDARVVVTVGRQDFQKGQSELVRAFDAAADSDSNTELLLVGAPGSQSAEVGARIRSSPHCDRIKVLGHRDDVPDILAAADVFVLPSLYEGFPGAVIEAMALGLPVVASDLPTLREVVGDGSSGLLVPPRDSAELAKAIGRVLDDAELAGRLGRKGREEFLARLTTEQSDRRMLDLYERLLAA
jgi:glycosyltransferase involved in cell wall biosynthesis